MSEMLRAIKTDEFKGVNDCYTLNNGVKIPCVGFGTYKAAQDESERVIKTAIEAGYRCFDTASFYGTEPYLGTAIKESKIPREEFFISSKAWKTEMGYSQVKEAFERTKKKHIGNFIKYFDSVTFIANNFITYKFKGINLLDYVEVMKKVTFEEVTERLNDHFKEENCVISIAEPK